jgi:hypothetical protein
MRSAIQFIKSLIPGWMKGYRVMRFVRIFLTPVLGSWNNLVTTGQLRSLLLAKPVNRKGEALPWFSYAAINFLDQLDLQGLRVFEYGTGNSTLFWSRKGATVRAVEFDGGWASYVRENAGPNAEIRHEPSTEEYAKAILQYDDAFDIIVVDGAVRELCAQHALERLSPDGFLVLDNSEAYPGVAKSLRESGLLQVDFVGPAPLVHTWQSTSIFFRRTHEFLGETAPVWIPGMTVFPKDWKPT